MTPCSELVTCYLALQLPRTRVLCHVPVCVCVPARARAANTHHARWLALLRGAPDGRRLHVRARRAGSVLAFDEQLQYNYQLIPIYPN